MYTYIYSINLTTSDQSNPFNFKLNTFASYIKVYVDAVTNNAYLDY